MHLKRITSSPNSNLSNRYLQRWSHSLKITFIRMWLHPDTLGYKFWGMVSLYQNQLYNSWSYTIVILVYPSAWRYKKKRGCASPFYLVGKDLNPSSYNAHGDRFVERKNWSLCAHSFRKGQGFPLKNPGICVKLNKKTLSAKNKEKRFADGNEWTEEKFDG